MFFECKYCGSKSHIFRLRIYENKSYKKLTDPKWLPHIQVYCGTCYRYNLTAKQTEELRTELDGQALIPFDFEAIENERKDQFKDKPWSRKH